MKQIILPFLILLTPIFLHAQSYEVVPRSNLSVFAGMRIQAIDFSNLNSQLADYNIGEMEGGVTGLMAGVQYQIPNTRLSTSIEASFVEACLDHVEGTETMAMLTGHSFILLLIKMAGLSSLLLASVIKNYAWMWMEKSLVQMQESLHLMKRFVAIISTQTS